MNRDIVVVGASAGGIEALKEIVRDLPPDFKAALFVVLHISAQSPGILPDILRRSGPLPSSLATDGDEIRPSHIYVAPPDQHMLLDGAGFVRLSRGPKENHFRPAVDPLFRSAALAFGSRVIGVVLTGGLDDGTSGLWAIKERGGIATVQDPTEATAPSMPLSALKHVLVDYKVRLKEIPPLLARLTEEPAEQNGQLVSREMETETKIARGENAIAAGIHQWGDVSNFACPECHGVLQERKEGTLRRFRCHTGHAYSEGSLLHDLTERAEEAMWNAIRSLQERSFFLRKLAEEEPRGDARNAEQLRREAEESDWLAQTLRSSAMQTSTKTMPVPAPSIGTAEADNSG
jgi:two-component system, chemotaxis family, protein-glutamate methylesterase/glutaminase